MQLYKGELVKNQIRIKSQVVTTMFAMNIYSSMDQTT